MKLESDPAAKTVKKKPRRYPLTECRFLNAYVYNIVDLGYLEPNWNSTWQSLLHLVQKDSNVVFPKAVDLRPINEVTKCKQWPMQNIEIEIQDFEESQFFASIDFCASFWAMLLHPQS